MDSIHLDSVIHESGIQIYGRRALACSTPARAEFSIIPHVGLFVKRFPQEKIKNIFPKNVDIFFIFCYTYIQKGGNKMTKDYFKRLTVKNMTAWDLNCRSILPHDTKKNALEKRFRRAARRKDKLFLKKVLTSY